MSYFLPKARLTMLGWAAVLLGTIGQAHGASRVGASFQLQLTVPIICRVVGTPLPNQAVGTSTIAYSVNAFCNSPRGYQIFALHDAEPRAGWVFRYNGVSIAANADGRTILIASDQPINETATLELIGNGDSTLQTQVRLLIEPR